MTDKTRWAPASRPPVLARRGVARLIVATRIARGTALQDGWYLNGKGGRLAYASVRPALTGYFRWHKGAGYVLLPDAIAWKLYPAEPTAEELAALDAPPAPDA